MFAAQPRLEQPRGRRALRMLEQPRFRAGFDLLLLRADMGLASRELADWWTKVQEVSQTDRDRMADALAPQQRPAGEGGSGAVARAVAAGVVGAAHPRPHERRSGRGRMTASCCAGCRPMSAWAAISRTRARRCARALEALGRLRGCRLVASSPLYRTQPLGDVVQPAFVNAVAGLVTHQSTPEDLLSALRATRTRARP